jgi:hypothetical protein
LRVTDQVRGGEIGEAFHRCQGPIVHVTHSCQLRTWLSREHFIPGGRLLLIGQNLRRRIRELPGDAGIERSLPRDRTVRAANSLPPSIRWNVASRAT